MPSEAHPQEPRDRGPPSLITRAGRNAQLAKAAYSSPAQDKRPRGRPRKDGSNGRPAPPPAPPPRSSRKKGRSRGQAQVEDEESMDAAEKEEPQKTEPKEVRAAGRRRSTSRRKSNTNPDLDPDPEPSQEQLSPPPAPEPVPISKSSPEPPSTAEEDLTSPPPTVVLPPPSPEEHPDVSSMLPPPDLNLFPGPDPSPAEEERPSLKRSPAEQSPAPSLRCSPPVSPCLRLDDSDSDSLSPLYQRSLSEDSGGSPTPILGHAKKRRKQCAFCYRGDEPLLGLGRLVVFGPTPGYIPLHILNRRTSSDRDSDCHEHCFHDNQAPPTCSSPEQCDESSSEFMKQLGPIGLPHDIDVQSLFDATGQCCAHLQCATWSEGVRRGEGQSLLFVDKAIDSGSIQVCAFCRHLGASLRCQETGCTRSYHMPCAAAAGACQDWNQRRILCTQHARTGSSQCRFCAGSGDSGSLLMCSCCGSCYHGSCLDPPVTPSPLSRVGWQCPECRVCRSCSLQGDGGVLLLCARCDKAYHAHCLTPPLDDGPCAAWTCKNCRTCRRCGVTSSGQWANNPFLCESCDLALPCPLCDRTPDSHTPQDYLTCSCCYRSVHVECSVQAGEGRAGSEGYICFSCKPQESEDPTPQSHSPAPPTDVLQPQPQSDTDVHSADSPVQPLCSDVAPSPARSVCVPSPQRLTPLPPAMEPSPAGSPSDVLPSASQTHTDSTNCQLPHAEDIYQSPAESPAGIQQSPEQSSEEVHKSQPPSSPNLQKDLALCHKERSPALSSEEIQQQSAANLQHNSLCSSENVQPSPVKSLSDYIQPSPPSPSDLHVQSPAPKEVFHGLTSEIHQNLISSSEEIQQSSSAPSENILKGSPVTLEEIQQSPAASSTDIQQSTEGSLEEIHQNPAPSSPELQKDPAPFHKKGIQQSLTGPPSPAASLEEIQQSSTAPSEKSPPSPAPSLEESQQKPKSPLEKAHQSPGAPSVEMVQSPTGPSEQSSSGPAVSSEEIQESPKSPTEQICLSPVAHSVEMVQSPTGPSEQSSSGPAASSEEIQESPKSPTEQICLSPVAPSVEMVQSPTGPSEQSSSGPAASSEEIQESPKSPTEQICLSPAAPSVEMVQSPTGPPEEVTASPAVTLDEIQVSPKSPTEQIHQSPAASLDDMVLSPAAPSDSVPTTLEPHLAEVPQTIDPPCEDICPSAAKLSPDLQQEPPPPSDNAQDLQTSPASTPLPAESHESPAQTPIIDNRSPAPCPEEHPGPSTVSASFLECASQSPGPLITKIQQSSESSPDDAPESPTPFSEEINQDPESLASKLQENNPQSPSEPQQCSSEIMPQSPALSSEEACAAPEPHPGVNQDRDDSKDQKSAPSSKEFLLSLELSPMDLNQGPQKGSEENQPTPVPSPKEIAHDSIISPAGAAEVCDGPSENADPIDLDGTPASSHTNQEKCSSSPHPDFEESPSHHLGSSPSPADSQTCQTSAHAQQTPSDLIPTSNGSPVQEASMSEHERSQSGLVCTTDVPQHSPPSSAGQDDETQLLKPSSPPNASPSQPDCSPQPGQLSPAQGGTSPQRSELEPNLDQTSPVEAPRFSALNRDRPPDHCRPRSAPCSPCAPPPMQRPLSLSQSASPAQLQAPAASDLGLNPRHQTLEENLAPGNSTSALPIDPHVESSPPILPVQTPESLEHISTSQEHSSLIFLTPGEETKGSASPLNSFGHSPRGGLSPCADAIEPASVSPSQPAPAESSVPCHSQSPPKALQPTSPMAPTETHSVEPEPAWNPEHEKLQQAEADPRSPENPAHSETPPVPPTDVCSPAEMDPPPASSSSPHCILTAHQDQDDQESPCPAAVTQSLPCSPADGISLSPEGTAPTESESPPSSPHHLEHSAITSTSLTKAHLSPASVSPLDHPDGSASPLNPSAAQPGPECVPQTSQTPFSPDHDAPEYESVISQPGPARSHDSSQVTVQLPIPVQTGPAQDNTVMPCPTLSGDASATPPSPTHKDVSPPQVAAPLPPQCSPSHPSPVASPACGLVVSEPEGPGPENSEVIPGLHEAETCPDLVLTKSGPASPQSAAADVEKKPSSSTKEEEEEEEDFHYTAQKNPEEHQGGEEAEEVQSSMVQACSPSEIPEDQPADAPLPCSLAPSSPPAACSAPPPQSPPLSPPPGEDEALPPLMIQIPCVENLTEVEESTPVSQSQSPVEFVSTVIEPTKDKDQSRAGPSQKEEELQAGGSLGREEVPMNKKLEVKEAETLQSDDEEEEKPISPVLDLGSSLDMEVMELMTSSPPPSLLHLSSSNSPAPSRRGKGRILRPPPCSSRPSDDLSIRLRQSPFSTEASPETSPARTPVTPPPLTPPSPPLMCRDSPPMFDSQAPPTVLPFTPKIGMGKPAISKRKFSSGRARIKQALWWSSRRALSPPSSSQDSMGEAGWESSKQSPLDSPFWSSTVVRGSGFPGRRRSRGGGVGGGRGGGGRGRSRLRTLDGLAVTAGTGFVEPFQTKEEEENSMHNTVVMFSTSDHFTLKQDMCVVCGSFGQGAEGRLLACSQCGQCYHPYCVNIKITRVILTKGWRCLECTVCEACGDASDPGRLLLCDDCDISYHTYCLDPPLHTVPKGAWKCKWCVWCVQCGSTSPGVHSDWQRNYSLCGPCCSLSRCPACQHAYAEDDLILQCQQCDRWVHATCQGLSTEDEVEVAADEGFDCSLCKAHERGTYGRTEALGPHVPHIMSKIREPDTKIYTQDGVCLTESGLSQLQSLVEPLSSPRRYRRCKPKLKLRITNQNSVFVLQTPVHADLSLEPEHSRGELDCDMKSDSSPERDRVLDDDVTKDSEAGDNSKKRKRKPYRPGIGGFMVRQRGGKAGPSRTKLGRKDSMEGEGMLDADISMETAPCAGPAMDKVKRRYRKKKGKLEEAFPSYLQEAFFGRDLLDRSRHMDKGAGAEVQGGLLQAGVTTGHTKVPVNGSQGPHTGLSAGAMATNRKQGTLPISEEVLVDLSDVLNTDPHILATGHAGQFQVERSPSPFAGIDINSMSDNPSLTSDPAGVCSRGLKAAQEEPLDAILSPELDKMVSDGAILSRLYKIPELEGKDVEEVFTAVMSPGSRSSQPDVNQHMHTTAVTKLHTQAEAFPRLPLMNGLMESAPRFPTIPGGPQGEAGFRMAHPEGPGSTPMQGSAPVSANQTAECEQDGLSTAQRGMLKWEKEESLGELATVAPVLYCNTNFPHLKQQYPDWPTRVKQIAKLWRKASSQDRAPFVQKARDNRAAQRISKVQLSNDPLKQLQPSQQQQQQTQQQTTQLPPPGAFDPVSMEQEMSFKDPLRPRESEQEQEWKMRQQMRQKSKQLAKMEATQKLEQVKNEQRQQQQLLSSQRRPDCLSPESASLMDHTHQSGSGDGTSPLHVPPGGRQHPNLQGGAAPADDVFLRPQAPPPSGLSSLPHSPHASSPLHQPPSSPQMFSPPSSRPSSPWDPYSKIPGTPRPPTAPQRGSSLTSSPSHDAMSSPIPSPDSKDAPRAPGPQQGLQHSRSGMLSPSSGIRTPDTHQRTNTRGNVFKAPMPPQQEVLGSTAGGRRDPSRPADLGYSLAQPQQDLSFPSSPLSGLGSPHRSPYSQAPGTPRPDCSDHYSQQSPLSSRPSPDPYSNPQTPGTPRSHSDPAYLTTPPALRLDHYNQQPATRRPSPSHPPLDPYASNPGTPRPSDRIPRSPGNQRSSDPYCQPVGTPRPPAEPYAQQPSTPCSHKSQEPFSQTAGESFPPQPGACGTSPLTLGLSTEPGAFTPTPHQQSPGKQPDSFSRTPKHPGTPDEASLNPGQDSFEQGHMTRSSSQTDSKAANMMSGAPSLDGPMSGVLADSEEKLRQRQRLRQLLLWQQQQKNALRQEKALQEPSAPHGWSQDNSSSAPTAAAFGRPPPPYPGTVRPCGAPPTRFPARFPGEQQSGFTSLEDPFPRQSMPRELAVRPPDVRFGALSGVQESLLHHPQGQAEGHPVQMRRPTDFSNIHPMMGTNMMPGLPQPFIPRPHPVQQHNMPYIELRHRAPESRMRLPFPLSATPDPKGPLAHPRDPHTSVVRAGHGPLRLGDAVLNQQMVMSGGIEQLSQQHMAHPAALAQSGETALPGPEGIEHLDGEDSAVKDLEDVEVKDLVDLNLNLDPEDGKEDLDLGPNDLHLDDFLLSGKFDLIAYAMDMVNEELDLGEPVEEKEGRERRDSSGTSKKTEGHAPLPEQVKQEGEGTMKTESGSVLSAAQLPSQHLRVPAPPVGEGVETGLPGVVDKDKLELSSIVAGSGLQPRDQPPPSGMARPPLPAGHPPVFQQQRPFTPSPYPHTNLGPHSSNSGPAHLGPVQPHVLLTPTNQPVSSTQAQTQSQNQNKARPLLLEEQPLLLQDLLDQERQEQQQQKQMQALIRQKPASEPVLPNTAEFDSISDPIMKAKMLALQGINKVMSQGSLGLNPMVINRFQQAPVAPGPEGPPQPPQVVPQDGKLTPQLVRRNPPSSGSGFVNESQRRQYEEWLGETQQLLQMQQRLLEDQITTHRKAKKALSAKQRTAKKAGRAFAEEDAAQLRYISEQQGVVQKQLEQIRKQQKDHTELIEDYKNKQQRPLQLPGAPQKTLPQPLGPVPPHQGGATQSRLPNAPPGWNPGVGPPRPVGQRMPLHLPPQMTPRLPNNPQTAPPMVPPLTAPTAAFTAGPRGPAGGLGGTSGDGAAPTPQVKFDDNNPFSEGFQERERRERLREQQERQRVQLMQEVERHRALQKKLEQQDLVEPSGSADKGVSSTPGGDGVTHLTFLTSEPRLDLLPSSSSSSRTTLQHQGQAGAPFLPQTGLQQGFTGERLHPGPQSDLVSGQSSEGGRDVASSLQNRQRLTGLPGAAVQSQRHTATAPMTPSQPHSHHFEHDSSSSSPLNPLASSFPCAAGSPASLLHMYSDITTEDKPKKRSRKKEGEDIAGGGGAKTPLSPHSDITAPPTPAVSDTSSSTPTHQVEAQFPPGFAGLAPSYELERQLSQKRAPVTAMDLQRGVLSAALLEVKEECMERRTCGGGVVKMEEGGGDGFSSSLQGGDRGKELLRHLLKEKASPASTPSPTRHAPPPACRQLSNDSLRSEEEEGPGALVLRDGSGADLLKKNQRCRRPARPDKDKAPTKNKRRKKEEEEKSLHSSSDPLMTHLRQLSMLPLMEPVLRVDLSLFPPYGSSSLAKDSRLTGSFGNACLDGVADFYSQLIYKQNNLSNPPTPPASLPPTPPPVVRQKMVNGFATTDELSRKDVSEQEVKGALKQKGDGLLTINPPSKTVDVPASLPTPPHNNQEELRVQDSSERSSPEGFVPSSSPESVADMEVSRYPDLSFIKLEPPSPCPSPTFPITSCAGGKGSAVKQEVKVEPNHQTPLPCSNTDLVTIAITLNPVAAQNVQGVMAAVAELLRVPVPANFQLSRAAGPEQSSLALLAGVRVPHPQAAVGCRAQRPAAAGRPQCCSHCKAALGNRVHVVQELKQDGPSKAGSSLMFCSPNCSALYASNLQSRPTGSKPEVPELLSGTDHPPSSRVQHQYTNNMSSIAVHSLPRSFSFPASSSPPPSFPPASAITMETQPRMDSLKVKVKLKPHPRALPPGEESSPCGHGKKMKTCRWRRWSVSITFSRGPCAPNEEVAMPTEEEVDVLLQKLGSCLRPDSLPKDQRRCCFCHQQGDGQTDGPARLLNLDLDLWAHLNCALWSSEVYETQAGALINVELALRRGLTLRCAFCQQTGATSGCNRLRCTNTYHFTCALQAHCTFFKDKTMLCPLHKPRMVSLGGDRSSSCSPSSTPGVISDPMVLSDPYDSELRCFSVFRRVFVQRDEARQIAAIVQRGERQHTFRVGSLLFRTVGRLLPHQISTFHNETAIFPVGYHANRLYWSMRHSNRRCKYMCHIEEVEGRPLFKVKVVEKGYEDLVLTGATPKAVWDQILEPVAQLRSSSGTLKLFPAYLKGEDLFGLTTSAVSRIIESLPGVEACERYTFRYGRNPLMEWPLAFNPSGSARSEPKPCQAKRPYLLTSVAPRCQGSVGAIVGAVPGVISLSPGESVAAAHQGRHSKSAQYRRMKAEWKSNVYLARSRIQGLGLYAARDIEKCTMVIEYIGAIIRSEVANRKERLYESQNRGVYMFRIDNDYVIDATITGGPARYINHSCAPNCITEVVNVEKENKIIISSCRRIQRGEELSYDYKFDLEDDQHKIPCHCGAVNCRKWMN